MKFLPIYIFIILIIFGCKHKTNDKKQVSKENKWVYILAGQSNMAGRGVVGVEDSTAVDGIYTLNKDLKLEPTKEPLHFYEPELKGVGPGFAFAKELKKQIPDSIEIILVPCAVGGSSIEKWLGDSIHRNVKLYSNFKKRAEKAKEYGVIKALLWHQGESNANSKTLPSYGTKLIQLISNFRRDIGNPELPVLLGELGKYSEPETKNKNWAALNHILDSIANTNKNTFIVTSDGLGSNPDKVHFNTEAQHTMGKRYTLQFLKTMK